MEERNFVETLGVQELPSPYQGALRILFGIDIPKVIDGKLVKEETRKEREASPFDPWRVIWIFPKKNFPPGYSGTIHIPRGIPKEIKRSIKNLRKKIGNKGKTVVMVAWIPEKKKGVVAVFENDKLWMEEPQYLSIEYIGAWDRDKSIFLI